MSNYTIAIITIYYYIIYCIVHSITVNDLFIRIALYCIYGNWYM